MREGYKMTELGEIPVEWQVKKLEDVCSRIFVGIATSTTDYYTQDGVPIIRNLNIKEDKLDKKDLLMVTEEFSNINENKKLKEGDILTVRTGYPGVSCIVPCELEGAHTFTTLISRPKEDVDSNYLCRYINSEQGKKFVNSGKAGGAQQNLNVAIFSKILVLIPPLKEQQKIASILSTVDEHIDETKALIVKTKELKKGLMQRLLTKGIGHTEFKETEIGVIPKEWEIKKFRDVSKVSQGLQIAISDRYKNSSENRYLYITIQYLNDKNNLDNLFYIENPNPSVLCKTDDILMTRTGNTGMIITNVEGVFHNNFFKIGYDATLLNKEYLVEYLKSAIIQNLIMRYAGTTTIPDLNHGDFYRIPVAIPSLEEQKKIASILFSVDEKLDQYETKKQKLQTLKQGLMQKLLTGKVRVK